MAVSWSYMGFALVLGRLLPHCAAMGLPVTPVTLTPEELAELNRKLSNLRHDVNNHLLLIMASAELLQLKPEAAPMYIKNLVEQPPKVSDKIKKFSAEFEQILGITHP
jgi:hypothetical protein